MNLELPTPLDQVPDIPALSVEEFSTAELVWERLLSEPPLVIENAKDGSLLRFIPGGKFQAGGTGSDEGGGVFEVEIPSYYMAMHPVTNGQYERFVKETGHRAPDKADYGEPVWK